MAKPLEPKAVDPQFEQKFMEWFKEQRDKLVRMGNWSLAEQINPNDKYYDYRAAFRAGDGVGEDGHWPSIHKADNHPNRFVRTPHGILDTKYEKNLGFTAEAVANVR